MSSVTKKPSRSNPPYYYFEGKGWRIETKIKIDGVFRKLNKGYYARIQDAKDDYQAQVEALRKRVSKPVLSHGNATWEDFKDDYLSMRRRKLTGSSLLLDKTRFNSIFDPLFKGMKAKDCFKREAAFRVQQSVDAWKANRKSKNKVLSYYLHMLEYAFDHEYLEQDSDYRKCKSEITMISSQEEEQTVKERQVLTTEQCQALLDAIEDARDKMLTTLLLETGLRIGEALVLRVCDFDVGKRELNVSRTLSINEFGEFKEYNRTKTALGQRTIPLSERFAALAVAYFKAMRISRTDLLFPQYEDRATPMDASAYRNRLTAYCSQAGIPKVTPHCLRHTFATLLSKRCVTDSDRQARAYIMGHSVTVDEEVYTAHNRLDNAKGLIGK